MKPIFLDCQATGLNPSKSEILEIAWGDKSYIIRPEVAVSRRVLGVIGLTEREISGGISGEELFTVLNQEWAPDFNRDLLFVAHFSRFEKALLDQLWLRFSGKPFDHQIICLHRIAKVLVPGIPNYSLRSLAGWYGAPLEFCKRASDHVLATRHIWNALQSQFNDQGIDSSEKILELMNRKVSKGGRGYKTLIDRDIRLSIPQLPGVYRFFNCRDRLLYVGKATSLKQRVNSYFTGGCRGDSRKLEMVAQIARIEVTRTTTPLDAAILEYDSIKEHKPPYNIVFTTEPRSPFKDLECLKQNVQSNSPPPLLPNLSQIFHGLTDSAVLVEGLRLWRISHGFAFDMELSERQLSNRAIPLLKDWILARQQKEDVQDDEQDDGNPESSDADAKSNVKLPVEFVWTSDRVANWCDRILRRCLRLYVRQLWLKRLSRASIAYGLDAFSGVQYSVNTCDLGEGRVPDLTRLRVLLAELRRIESNGGWFSVVAPWPMKIPDWI